jgi:hypothetical protein
MNPLIKKIIVICISCFVLMGCSSGPKSNALNVSEFNLVPTALKNEDSVKVIYTYRGGLLENNKDYYYPVVAIAQKTGDTVNILTLSYTPEEYEKDKIYSYFDTDQMITKIAGMDPKDKMLITNMSQWDTVQLKPRHKVLRDQKTDKILKKSFPTVIGTIGTVTRR